MENLNEGGGWILSGRAYNRGIFFFLSKTVRPITGVSFKRQFMVGSYAYFIFTFYRRVGRLVGAWCAKRNNHNQWLQVDLRGPTRITKVTTQGRYDANQFVRSYYLYYSQNGRTFLPIKEGRKIKVGKTEEKFL